MQINIFDLLNYPAANKSTASKSINLLKSLDVVAYSTRKTKARRVPQIQGQPEIHSEY